MAYEVYLNNFMLPVAPEKISIKVPSGNENFKLADNREYTIINGVGLREISFSILLPNSKYSFANYPEGYQKAGFYLNFIKSLKDGRESVELKIIRKRPNGETFHDDVFNVVIEDYQIEDEVSNGFDVNVSLNFREYNDLESEIANKMDYSKNNEKVRATKNSPTPKSTQSYTVKNGDTLWGIAKKFYGDGSKLTLIEKANKDKIKDKNKIYVGQVFNIPKV